MMVLDTSKKQQRPTGQRVDRRDPIEVLKQEKLITARDIQSALTTMGRPWTLRQATEWMANDSGCAFQLRRRKSNRKSGQRGGPWYITKQAMRRRWPEIMELIEQDALESAERGDA